MLCEKKASGWIRKWKSTITGSLAGSWTPTGTASSFGNRCPRKKSSSLPEKSPLVNSGAVERTRTSTVLLPPAPQAGASASSATTAQERDDHSSRAKPSKQVAEPRHRFALRLFGLRRRLLRLRFRRWLLRRALLRSGLLGGRRVRLGSAWRAGGRRARRRRVGLRRIGLRRGRLGIRGRCRRRLRCGLGDLLKYGAAALNGLIGEKNERSEEHTSELQSPCNLVCRLLLEKKKKRIAPVKSTVCRSSLSSIPRCCASPMCPTR